MCGIVGILGKNEVAPILVDALRRLEYRGYDSAGIATVNGGELDRRRAVGKLVNLSDELVHNPLRGKSGIGHTRWATHGVPSVENAHPHKSGPVAVVHNGIIENFKELRADLKADGYEAQTQTDTETIVMLCARELARGKDPRAAVAATLAQLHGAFAVAFLFEGEEDLMIAARKGSPLAIGYGEGEMYIGSDALALAPMTNRVAFLEEGDRAEITRAGATVYDESGAEVTREVRSLDLKASHSEKGNYRHFMIKEIHDQPAVLSDALAHYLNPARDGIALGLDLDFTAYDRIVMVACGTAFYACHVAKYWLEDLARVPVEIDVASEFRYREPPLGQNTLAIFVSQSGETADTLAALRYCKGKAKTIMAIVNVEESSIARESDVALPIHAGPEIGVASTKAFTCQLALLAALTIEIGAARGTLDGARQGELTAALAAVPGLINGALNDLTPYEEISYELAKASDILFLGRGALYPLALEGALKLKEISYIHAEGYASGELKHGPIALIDESVPVITFAPTDPLFEKTVSNMQEVMARGGRVLLVSDATGLGEAGEDVWSSLTLPQVDPFISPILYAIPAQLLAYYTAIAKGTDVDQPRNLAKSVTVE
ncbi:glutamine--fructose-6-phosphate transaminase (isomerizing) [Paracoccaceae bacterium GXU_MW_L88]